MNDLFAANDKGCFLANKRWKEVRRDNGRLLFTPQAIPLEWCHIVDDYYDALAELPRLAKWGWMLREAFRRGLPVPMDKVAALREYSVNLRGRFVEWFKLLQDPGKFDPTEEPSQDPASIYNTVLVYPEKWAGAFYLGYWASMLIIQETINQCRGDNLYGDQNKQFVRNILRSVENISKGMMGPLRVGYAIRIAFEFADVKAQTWLKMWLERFQATYAATSKSDYPETKSNEYGYS
jgi:hypothetical protein